MFKKAIVLKVFNTNENYNIAKIRKIIKELGLLKYESIPDFNNIDEVSAVLTNILPKTLLCLTLDSSDERKVLLCNPMSSSHIQTPVKVGELIWYFKDTTFNDVETNNLGFLSIKHYWHSRVSSNISNENPTGTPVTSQELDLFSNFSQIDIHFDNLLDINGQQYLSNFDTKSYFSDSLLLQDGHNNIISLNKKENTGKINIISGTNLEIDDIEESRLNDHASVISINEYSSLDELMFINYFEDSLFLTCDKSQNFVVNNNKNTLKTYEKDILLKLKESNAIENISNNISKNIENNLKPNITIKSEDIYIVSSVQETSEHETYFEDEDDSARYIDSSGKIEIVRSSNQNFNSKITIDEMNDIKLDGDTIYVGNFVRNLVKKNIIDDETLNNPGFNPTTFIETLTDFTNIDNMCGKGDGVILGYEKSLSEPLVLGNTLISLLKDMIDLTNTVIDQNKSLIKEIKSMSDEYINHTHPPIPTAAGPQPVNVSLNVSTHTGFGSKADNFDKKLTETKDRFININQNLKYTLSRFSKTS